MSAYYKPFAVGFAGAVVATLLVLASWHLWLDHKALHEVIGWVNAVNANAQKAQAAQGGGAPTK